jgi:hypothetical protein
LALNFLAILAALWLWMYSWNRPVNVRLALSNRYGVQSHYGTVRWTVERYHILQGNDALGEPVFQTDAREILRDGRANLMSPRILLAQWDLFSHANCTVYATQQTYTVTTLAGVVQKRYPPTLQLDVYGTSWAYPVGALVACGIVLLILLDRKVQRQLNREGLCVHCGYDLRATPERCPECGNPVQTAAA